MSKVSDLLNPDSGSRTSPAAPSQPLGLPSEDTVLAVVAIQSDQYSGGDAQSRTQDQGTAEPNSSIEHARAAEDTGPSDSARFLSSRDPNPPTTANFPAALRQDSTLSPVEPSPPTETADQLQSSTLLQYHYASGSPPLSSRPSLGMRSSPPPTLPPIRSVPQSPEEHRHPQLLPSLGANPEANAHGQYATGQRSEDQAVQAQVSSAQPQWGGAGVSASTDAPALDIQQDNDRNPSLPPKPETIPGLSPVHPSVQNPAPDVTLDDKTAETLEIKREDSTHTSSRDHSMSRPGTPGSQGKSAARKVAGRKKAAPKRTKAPTGRKAPAKKRAPASGSRSTERSSLARRSDTPASQRASRPPAATTSKQSAVPSASPVPASHGSDEGEELYCICRRPDNHTWMIACDGGCEDWFHGSCVNVKQEDEDLIDKYICPGCEMEGKRTTWKRRCRLDGCRQPALVGLRQPSKYCSEEHGREFMRRLAQVAAPPKGTKRKRTHGGTAAEVEMEPIPATGGVLAKEHLAAVARSAKDGSDFRRIGDSVLTPPPTAVPEDTDDHPDTTMSGIEAGDETTTAALTDAERQRVSEIDQDRARLLRTMECLRDRERFLQLVKDRAKRAQDDLASSKDMCGFDPRLIWTDDEFLAWRSGEVGERAFREGVLPASAPAATATAATGDDVDMQDDDGAAQATAVSAAAGICQKKRCERHRQWRNTQLQDIRFEEANAANRMRLLAEERNGIRDRARLRRIVEAEGDRQGAVEVVG